MYHKHKGSGAVVAIIGILVVVIIGVVLYVTLSKNENSEIVQPVETESGNETPSPTTKPPVESPIPGTATSGTKNCGSDLSCLANAAKTCQRAKAASTTSLDFFGILMTSKQTSEIRGLKDGKCEYYVRNDEHTLAMGTLPGDLTLDPEMAEEAAAELAKMNEGYDQLEGRYATCLFTNAELSDMLSRWHRGEFSGSLDPEEGDLPPSKCSGTMFDPLPPELL